MAQAKRTYITNLDSDLQIALLGSVQFMLPSAIFKGPTPPRQHNVFSISWCFASLANGNDLCISIEELRDRSRLLLQQSRVSEQCLLGQNFVMCFFLNHPSTEGTKPS